MSDSKRQVDQPPPSVTRHWPFLLKPPSADRHSQWL